MRTSSRMMALAVGTLALLCPAAVVRAQGAPEVQPIAHIASFAPGSIQGIVQDEQGAPVAGAMVSALGATTAFAVTDRTGRFELRTLSPGPYLVRAHLAGFVAPRGQIVDVRPSARSTSAIGLRHAAPPATSYPVLAAGLGALSGTADASGQPADVVGTSGAASGGNAGTADSAESSASDDHGEVAWRLRHARRGILKDATIPEEILVGDTPPDTSVFGPATFLGRAVGSPARLATNFFAGTPFSGQVNLLTTGSFDTPQQLFSNENFSRSIAYLALGAPVGQHADWAVRAALTQGDIASWIVAGEYTTRAPARHRYDVGWTYSTQRYDGGNFAALRSVRDGSRNAGALSAFDTFAITPGVTFTYGGRYARYDYLADSGLFSPRLALTVSPTEHFRVSTLVSRRAVAPGAEEFMPRMDTGVWLPPQRTFSSLFASRPLEAEHTSHVELEVEHDLAAATVSIRAYRQRNTDQLVTLFGVDVPGSPAAHLGHYFVSNVGDIDASGVSTGVRAALAGRIHGSVEYSVSRARWMTGDDAAYTLLFAPSAVRFEPEHIHDLATSVETDVPETSTRVLVLYRISNAFAHAPAASAPATSSAAQADRPSHDARFDVQVRQALPFMDFSTAKWEMLVAVRNFFRDTAADQSVYDELLVVRPPKRIVGGLTLKF
jgi:hypothetical protein